jgi:excinuclease ABC subunit C
MTNEQFKAFSPTIPTEPGIYKFMDAEGRDPVRGQSQKPAQPPVVLFRRQKTNTAKTKALVKHAHHIEFMIVETETTPCCSKTPSSKNTSRATT